MSPAHDLGEGSFHQIVRRDVEVQLYLRLQTGEKHKSKVVFTQGREEWVIDSNLLPSFPRISPLKLSINFSVVLEVATADIFV